MSKERKKNIGVAKPSGVDFSDLGLERTSGKVRDIYNLGDGRLLIKTTDRLSAFDRQVGVIPGRGQILNELSAFWFENTSDIVPNHMIEVIDPNVMVVKECERIDLEMVVRGFLTGVTDTSIWMRYQSGQRNFGEVLLPDGMKKNQSLLHPILDPTTKASVGHDKAIMKYQIIEAGIVTAREYEKVESTALKLFARG
ncbi:MAG TPA: phosphoribosylaminoimidazolesuccinocarboxamide synthase, partial [Patescibacteria group bacterium]